MTALRKYNAKRDANEGALVRVLEDMGCRVYRLDQPCDLLVLVRGDVLLVEVKMPKGTLNDNQQEFVNAGWPVHVIRTEDDAINLVKRLRSAA